MDRALSGRSRRSRGDAIVEFAILAPVLVLILFGVLEMGRVVNAWLVVHNAAREGARAGVRVYPDAASATAAQSAASAYLTSGLGPGVRGDIASPSTPPTVQVTSDTVQVTTSTDVQLYTPLFQAIAGTSAVHVQASASMRRE
jgi:Flp pilus assembly protein TadG